MKKIDLKTYEIFNLEEKKQFKFSLITNEIIFFEEYYVYGERDFFDELGKAIEWFEKLVAKDIFLSWVYKMDLKSYGLKEDTDIAALIHKIYEKFDFLADDLDVEFTKVGFWISTYFEYNDGLREELQTWTS